MKEFLLCRQAARPLPCQARPGPPGPGLAPCGAGTWAPTHRACCAAAAAVAPPAPGSLEIEAVEAEAGRHESACNADDVDAMRLALGAMSPEVLQTHGQRPPTGRSTTGAGCAPPSSCSKP